MRTVKIYLISILLLWRMVTLQAQTDQQTQTDSLLKKIEYTQKDFSSFMQKNRAYTFGVALFYDWQNFPNAANKQWMSMQSMGLSTRGIWYPLLMESTFAVKSFNKINSPYQIPTFQSININKYRFKYSVSLSVFPIPYIPALKRTQEYISPYVGIGYQWEDLKGWSFDGYDGGYFQLNLSSWYWKAGCNISLGDLVPVDLFVEYAHTLNPDKIRNYEWLRVGITFRFEDIFKLKPNKSNTKSLIHPKL